MDFKNKSLGAILADLTAAKRDDDPEKPVVCYEPPLRAELFNADEMAQHGRTLARSHVISYKRAPDGLLERLEDNEEFLIGVHHMLTESVEAKRHITPAAEWLLDNFYLIEEQIRIAKRHLPKGYSRELPRLAGGPSSSLPRVYDIALEIISHGDGRVDPEILTRFTYAYQSHTSLKLGELWAIPIMLRLALIENLRRVAGVVASNIIDRNLADFWADRMTEKAAKDPKNIILVIADMARSNPSLGSSFVAELTRRLQDLGPLMSLPLNWIEQRLAECGQSIHQMVQAENQAQAADQVSMSNAIGSLRFLGAMDWREFVDTMSEVEKLLHEDPAQVYGKMDFFTRDRYRHVVERMARKSKKSEIDVAREALNLAREEAARNPGDERAAHIGFYLIDEGRPKLRQRLQGGTVPENFLHRLSRHVLLLYLAPIALLTGLLSWGMIAVGGLEGAPAGALGFIALVFAVGVSQLAVSLVNWTATMTATPRPLPRMDFTKGIPPEYRTLVVIPTMLASVENIEKLLEALEVRFLSNRDAHLHYALLTDFKDAQQEEMPDDKRLLERATRGIETLNARYAYSQRDAFFLFHRPRKWNPSEQLWMGYERKRGKLASLNAVLLGHKSATDDFSVVVGNRMILRNMRYVITLDSDTKMGRDAARQFVAAMVHPLNRARYDDDKGRVTEGYGILQPRVAVSVSGINRSRYAAMFAGESGIDPYTRAVSDVYQDLFSEGSFIGKGIYDVEVFQRALQGRFPDNRILSHDLLEGCYLRSGLISDVLLYEEHPSRYSDDVNRRHRWIRGDWQIARWLLPRVPGRGGRPERNPLSWLSRWKIFDNLRRSAVPVALTIVLILAWIYSSAPYAWSAAVAGIVLIPPLINVLVQLLRKPDDVMLGGHLQANLNAAGRQVLQGIFILVCLPYEAYVSADAVMRTNWRLLASRRALLEWSASDLVHGNDGVSLGFFYRCMWPASVLAAALIAVLAILHPVSLAANGIWLLAWLLSPPIAWWVSRPVARRESRLGSEEALFLRRLARKTWSFFEIFVGPEDHWLPPDNFQEHPARAVAHRTSPTNIGLSLLANLTAYDFGFISARQLIERTQKTIDTLYLLERYRGHFYNWYNTETLQILQPAYISTVDSGNLAGHLLTLRQGLLHLADKPVFSSRIYEGLMDAVGVTEEVNDKTSSGLSELKELLTGALSNKATLASAKNNLEVLASKTAELERAIEGVQDETRSEMKWWTRALAVQCREVLDEVNTFFQGSPEEADAGQMSDGAIPTLRQLANSTEGGGQIDGGQEMSPDSQGYYRISSLRAKERITTIEELALRIEDLTRMDFRFLFDRSSNHFAIGFNVADRRRDMSYYDLLASEARFSSFIAIAQGQLPQESWFSMGRLLTNVGKRQVLLSWSGSMFEYLMPLLVMPTYDNTLLDQTYHAAVALQIDYGKRRGVPWGNSESCFNAVDNQLTYQYRAFGVPGLGLKRGLSSDLVVAPYATAMALMVAPKEAHRNLKRLEGEGALGPYGFYEALDYTAARLPRGQSHAVVRSFMTHHQSMTFLALSYVLLGRPMQQRFEAEPMFRATMLLLQERIPKVTAFYAHTAEVPEQPERIAAEGEPMRIFTTPHTAKPEIHLLSNGKYHVMVTNAGSGYSKWKDYAVTRWRGDVTRDDWGQFCFLCDTASGEFWSASYQPTRIETETYETIYSESKAEFRCRHHDIDSHMEIAVSPEDNIELRRVKLINRSGKRRSIEITSYCEVVLAPASSDELHPVFSNLFVQSEILHERRAILCTRRPRSKDEQNPWMFHLMAADAAEVEEASFETSRVNFIGRGRSIAQPKAMMKAGPLGGAQGSIIDPICSIRCRVFIEPEEAVIINIVTGIEQSRDAALHLIRKYHDKRLCERVFDLAWTHSDIFLRQINAAEADAQIYSSVAGSVIYANSSLRAEANIIAQNTRGQSGLWGFAISGDLPIVLLRVESSSSLNLVRQMIQAHTYWRLKGLAVDLMIWNEDHAGYRQELQEQIMGLIASGVGAHVTEQPGGIFLRPADQVTNEEKILLQTVARVIISDRLGSLADQLRRRSIEQEMMPRLSTTRSDAKAVSIVEPLPRRDLLFFNGIGGFTGDGREYIISTGTNQVTPAPWVNVVANPDFGTVISENGSAYTWFVNAHEFRISPWVNDPVIDAGGEAFYLRDEERGHFWSPMPYPAKGATPYVTRHGFGYTVFEHSERGIYSETWVYAAMDSSVKLIVIKIRNNSGRKRRLSATGYVELILGDVKAKTAMHVVTEIEPVSNILFAGNRYSADFQDYIVFFDVNDPSRTVTGDRTEFIGRNGSLQNPSFMTRSHLSGRVGAGLDPCAAINAAFDISPGEEREIVFTLGAGRNRDDAGILARRYRGRAAAQTALAAVWDHWGSVLRNVTVETPDNAINFMANGWLIYQTLCCRLWARSGYYQSGGAFGFRDQLQDVLALMHTRPFYTRHHILRAAGRQFEEGDVQHWWHPVTGRGVRTRCSDDYLWLPFAVNAYIGCTGDEGILDETIPFLEGRPLNPDEESYYDVPSQTETKSSLYEHCRRAILRGLSFGDHGLPLMGSGDWNDGMNKVGSEGKGESAWLGFFLFDILNQFGKIARLRNDASFAERCVFAARELENNLERYAWDGSWYLRAYFDDGMPLGSAKNTECSIDSIVQSWPVLSGAGDETRHRKALDAAYERLVKHDPGIVRLLDPPFNVSSLEPGYIKGYVPGVRENGGQYTHAAIWLALAFARLRDRRAWEIMHIINPVHHAMSPEAVDLYKVEPYAVPSDVYALPPNAGRGGWTWYTGSSAWMYRLIIETLLGISRTRDGLAVNPLLPDDWPGFKAHYQYQNSMYHIEVIKAPADAAAGATLDGMENADELIRLVDDGKEHIIRISIPS